LDRADLLDDLLGGERRAGGKVLDLGRDDGESLSGLAGSGCFDRCVQREQVGLVRDLGDQVDDVTDSTCADCDREAPFALQLMSELGGLGRDGHRGHEALGGPPLG